MSQSANERLIQQLRERLDRVKREQEAADQRAAEQGEETLRLPMLRYRVIERGRQ